MDQEGEIVDSVSIWQELQAPLRRYIRRRVRSSHDAEDLFQEVAVRIERHRDLLPPAGRRVRWALRIARNLITDHYRSRPLRSHQSVDEMQASLRPEPSSVPGDLSE